MTHQMMLKGKDLWLRYKTLNEIFLKGKVDDEPAVLELVEQVKTIRSWHR